MPFRPFTFINLTKKKCWSALLGAGGGGGALSWFRHWHCTHCLQKNLTKVSLWCFLFRIPDWYAMLTKVRSAHKYCLSFLSLVTSVYFNFTAVKGTTNEESSDWMLRESERTQKDVQRKKPKQTRANSYEGRILGRILVQQTFISLWRGINWYHTKGVQHFQFLSHYYLSHSPLFWFSDRYSFYGFA